MLLYERDCLLIAPFVERFKTTTLSKSYLKVLLVVKPISLSNSNGIPTHNHLVCKRTVDPLAKWLSVRLRTK